MGQKYRHSSAASLLQISSNGSSGFGLIWRLEQGMIFQAHLINGRIHFLVVEWLRTLGSYCQLEATHSSQTCLWAVHSMWNFFFQFTKMESDVANHHTVSPLANSWVPRTIALWFTKISIIFSRHTTFIGMLCVFSEIICLVIKVLYLYPGWVAKLVGASSRIWNKFSDFVPSQGPCLGCRFNPQLRCLQETNW